MADFPRVGFQVPGTLSPAVTRWDGLREWLGREVWAWYEGDLWNGFGFLVIDGGTIPIPASPDLGLVADMVGSGGGTPALRQDSQAVVPFGRPADNPRFSITLTLAQPDADLTGELFGFMDAFNSATANGAYYRHTTTGNLFAVCRQGGAETTVNLGAVPPGRGRCDVITQDGGLTWVFIINDSPVAAISTNVPTSSVGLGMGLAAVSVGAFTGPKVSWASGGCNR